ncbi:hypothetical protein [Parasphingopyxis lamellibrachiae]|uniref:Lipoprotein n=1 Tax=Parasphingopyxis lamellibrachiae TaxID=680125 RepID=A0A3D9FDG9_9SPHN|nr:hypothetical protein [Parasphingopyxis lamellibrachiae]RED15829.1 hypothetical protein DFR46_0836 [Parasphingopyxis lamellibrachiae]
MRKVLVLASVLALGACAETAPEADPATEVEATEDAGVDMSAWVGEYALVYDDGTEATLTIAADGAYSGTSGEETVTGAITLGDGGAFCYTAEGSDDTECWTNGEANDDGSWVSTSDAGRSATVTRMEETAEAEPAG